MDKFQATSSANQHGAWERPRTDKKPAREPEPPLNKGPNPSQRSSYASKQSSSSQGQGQKQQQPGNGEFTDSLEYEWRKLHDRTVGKSSRNRLTKPERRLY